MAFQGEGSMTSWKLYTKVCPVGRCRWEDRGTGKSYTISRRRIKKFPPSQRSPQSPRTATTRRNKINKTFIWHTKSVSLSTEELNLDTRHSYQSTDLNESSPYCVYCKTLMPPTENEKSKGKNTEEWSITDFELLHDGRGMEWDY